LPGIHTFADHWERSYGGGYLNPEDATREERLFQDLDPLLDILQNFELDGWRSGLVGFFQE